MPQGSETVVVHPYAGRDENGDPLQAQPTRELEGCVIWPRTAANPERGDVIIQGLNVYVQPGLIPPAAKDAVTARGTKWEVDGVPGHYVKGSGENKGWVVVLKVVGS